VRIETTKQIFDTLFRDLKIEIVNYEILNRNQLNENNEWIEDTPSIFVGVTISGDQRLTNNISDTLTNLTGYEYNVYTV
jgi:hypothetical protein